MGHDLTAVNLHWTHVAKNFKTQWKALKSHKDEDNPDIPKITRALPIIKWTEAFQDFLHQTVGVRTIPLAYVIRSNVDVSPQAPPLQENQPHSEQHGSVEAEMVAGHCTCMPFIMMTTQLCTITWRKLHMGLHM